MFYRGVLAAVAACFACAPAAAASLYETSPLNPANQAGPSLTPTQRLAAYAPITGTNQISSIGFILTGQGNGAAPRISIYGNRYIPAGAPIFTSDYAPVVSSGQPGWVDFDLGGLSIAGPFWIALEVNDRPAFSDAVSVTNATFENQGWFAFTQYDGTWSNNGSAPFVVRITGEQTSPFPEGNLINPAIPEPATWAMMIGGFGLVGGAMRTRRSASSRRAAHC